MKSLCEQDGRLYAHLNFLSHVHLNARPPGLSRGQAIAIKNTFTVQVEFEMPPRGALNMAAGKRKGTNGRESGAH